MGSKQVPAFVRDGVRWLEESEQLDRLANALGPLAERANKGPAGSVLRGEWLGHALHPLLTDIPIGCWTSANVLDLVGGRRSQIAARRLVGIGILAVPLTAAAGLADWGSSDDEKIGRVGAVHAAGNVAATVAYVLSWRARRRGRHARGVALALVGSAIATGAGYLGGHLSFVRGSGVESRGGLDEHRDVETGPLGLGDLVDDQEAAALLEVTPDRVQVMVEEGLLQPVLYSAGGPRFERTDVLAVRLLGG